MGRRWWHQVHLWALHGFLGVLLVTSVTVRAQELTPLEHDALDRGELVTRRKTVRKGSLRLMGGMSYQVIDAPIDDVWLTLLETQNYPKMLPQVTSAQVVESQRTRRVVEIHQGAGLLDVTNYVELKIDARAREIEFRLAPARRNALRAAYGLYSLRSFSGGRTLLVYAVMADIGGGLIKSLLRESVHEWMLKVPWTIRGFVERTRARHVRQAPNAGLADPRPAPKLSQ